MITRQLTIIVLLFLLSGQIVFGQTFPNRSFEFQLSPQFPEAGEVVAVYAETFGFDISRANVTWKVNGKEVDSGIGIQEINVVMDIDGKPVTVELFAARPGETIERQITIRPSSVDIIIEPQTYTPVGYKGKGFITHQAPIRAVAMSFSKTYKPENLIYTWKYNNTVLSSQSGVGKNTILITGPVIGRNGVLRVTTESRDGKFAAQKDVVITTQDPEVLLYFLEPLMGINYSEALLGSKELIGDEITLIAEPYYFPGTKRNDVSAKYVWELDGLVTDSGNDDLGSITLRSAGKGRGSADIFISVENQILLPLIANTRTKITFGRETNNLFGF